MKNHITLITSVIVCLSCLSSLSMYAQTSNDSLMQATAIVDGLFFDKSVPAKSLIPGESTIAILKDPEGNKVMAVYLPQGYIMEETIVNKAIPAECVKYAQKLLRDYEGRKPQTTSVYSGIGVTVGEPFIDFEYRDTENIIWNNEKLKDKVYVINMWQTECGPCRREMPTLSKWKEQFPDVVFLSASRHNTEEILPIVNQHNFTWTHLQEATDLVALVRQQGFPLTIVVDKGGIVRFAEVGASEENQAEAVAIIEGLTGK